MILHHLLFLLNLALSHAATSILFTTLGKLDYSFDIYALPYPSPSHEIQITDGRFINFNGYFPSLSNSLPQLRDPPPLSIIYVSERNGTSSIYYDAVFGSRTETGTSRLRSALETNNGRMQIPLLEAQIGISMKDKPSLTGENLIYVSTHEDPGVPRASWAAVYSTELSTGLTRRLSPPGVADFSPAVSPSGLYTAVASYGERGWSGEVEELSTDIYVFLTRDGTRRVKAIEHGGWPSWVDESTFFFHRRSEEDEWISVYKATLPSQGPISTDSVVVERVTPPGLHAFTPATSPGNYEFIAVATRRPNSEYRHVEIYSLVKKEFTELTRSVSPKTHHLNPFISADANLIGYHRCRGAGNSGKVTNLLLENLRSPMSDVSLFRIDGSFPSFSPTGDRIAFVDFPGVHVVNRDGSNRRQIYPKMAFSTAWNPVHKGLVYTATGPTFASESTEVDIISINVDDTNEGTSVKKLTTNGENNAFPSVSPDGKWLVFRSGRSGYKNLYIMDAIEGESGGLYRLTRGPWSDTMCNWSPDGKWILFASDRDNPGSGSFELYMIHPNGTRLRKLVQSGSAGRTNHPWFSPDGKSVVFTSDYAGISAEPLSNPHHYQPYGEIFTIKLDGSDLKRMTHNSFEDGTPTWGPAYIPPADVESPNIGPKCSFEDCHFLNRMPNSGGFGIELLESVKSQCGA